jgi:hypothetical protein
MSKIHLATAAILSAALLFTTAPESVARGGKMGGGRTSLITQTEGGGGANKPIIRDHRNPRLKSPHCQVLPKSHFCTERPRR